MIEIKWKASRYKEHLSASLFKLQQDNCLCDVEIVTVTGKIPMHRLILEAFTGTLSNMKSNSNDINKLTEECSKFSHEIVTILVQYLYTGEVLLDMILMGDFIKLCSLLNLSDVVYGIQSEFENFTKSMNEIHFDKPSYTEKNLHDVVPVSLISNKNNKTSQSIEETLMELNSGFRVEVKKEPIESNDTNIAEMSKDNDGVDMEEDKHGRADIDRCQNPGSYIDKIQLKDVEKKMCCKCNRIFEVDEYVKHMKLEHRVYACNLCDWTGSGQNLLTHHKSFKHKVDHTESFHQVPKESKTETIVICNHCKYKTIHKDEMQRHLYLKHCKELPPDITLLKCDQCDQSFTRHNALKKHMMKHLLVSDSSEEETVSEPAYPGNRSRHEVENQPLKSIDYKNSFSEETEMKIVNIDNETNTESFDEDAQKCIKKEHNRTHHAERIKPKVTCEICNKMVFKDGLKRHQRSHGSHFNCTLCTHKFTDKWELKDHIRLHKQPMVCEICGKQFHSRNAFSYHMRSHGGKRPFHCSYCDKGFLSRQNYDGHLNSVHFKSQPYRCEKCFKGFSYSHSLLRHINEKVCLQCTPEKRDEFNCTQCNSVLKSSRALQEHIKGKHAESELVCGCGKTFQWERSFRRHRIKFNH